MERRGGKSSSSNCLVAAFVLVIVALAASTIALGVLYGQAMSEDDSNDSGLCQSVGCIKAANRILGSMDLSADPCDDFFQYSCGAWIDDHIIGESQSSTSVFNDVRDHVSKSLKTVLETPISSSEADSIQKAKKFYKSCMNTDKIDELGTAPVLDLITTMGGWPILGDDISGDARTLEVKLAEFNTLYGTAGILYCYVGTDSKSSSDNIFTITEPSLGLPNRDYYLDAATNAKTVPSYKEYIVNFLTVMNSGTYDAKFTDLAAQIVEFETKIAEKTMTSKESGNEADVYNKLTLTELGTEITADFNWEEYVTKAMEVADEPEIVIESSTEVIMYAKKYTLEFMNIIKQYDDAFIQNYLVWRVMKGRNSYMPKVLRDARDPYNEAVSGTTAESARWQTCADQSESYFPMPVGSLFVQAYFPGENKKKTETMVEQIRESFKQNLDDIDWMDSETKEKAETKADLIRKMIAYPDYIVDDPDQMDESYKTAVVDEDAFFDNAQSLNILASKWSYGKLNEQVDKDEWISGPAIVNAFYSPTRNQIFFPAGILQPPFYDQYQPAAMNYGGIGMVIGHEITHGFDDSGANFDGYGNLVNWWTAESKANFEREAQCMIDQYGNEYWEAAGKNLNGELTLGENIADNGGIRESFLAFREWQKAGESDISLPGLQDFSEEQLFFLGFSQVWCGKYTEARAIQLQATDPHSPGEFRVKIPGFNYEEFGKAYKCQKGIDLMYPEEEDTCRVW